MPTYGSPDPTEPIPMDYLGPSGENILVVADFYSRYYEKAIVGTIDLFRLKILFSQYRSRDNT